ncbi:MAG: hypothetical protein KKF56_02825 [Nanoarchaeota archaeon]|nr:hypothetical protein [Nanoarchaeota archaeon]
MAKSYIYRIEIIPDERDTGIRRVVGILGSGNYSAALDSADDFDWLNQQKRPLDEKTLELLRQIPGVSVEAR